MQKLKLRYTAAMNISKCSVWSITDFYSQTEYVQQKLLFLLFLPSSNSIYKKAFSGKREGIDQKTAYIKTAANPENSVKNTNNAELPF